MLYRYNMLTKKQELAIEYRVQGMNQTEAVMKAFDCKNKDSAKAIASRLFKNKEVNERLTEKQLLLDEKTTQMTADFLMLVKQSIPPSVIITKLKENLNGSDKRIVDSTIDKYLKIIGGYKDKTGVAVGLVEKITEDNNRG